MSAPNQKSQSKSFGAFGAKSCAKSKTAFGAFGANALSELRQIVPYPLQGSHYAQNVLQIGALILRKWRSPLSGIRFAFGATGALV